MDGMDGTRMKWLSVLVITTISGIIIRVVGDPLVDVTSPKIEDFFEGIEEWWEDTHKDLEKRLDATSDRPSHFS